MAHSNKGKQAVETFAQAVCAGKTQREAWRVATQNFRVGDASADVRACEFAKRPEVVQRIAEIRAATAERAQMSRDELVGMLTAEIRQCYRDNSTLLPVMKQVDCLTRVCGYDKQTIDLKAEVGAADPEAVAEKLNFLVGQQGKGRRK